MSENELMGQENKAMGYFDDTALVAIAAQAEKRVEAMRKIKNTAIMLTNEGDWVDQNGKPYLQVSGAEKIAALFGIGWSFLTPEPDYEEDAEGHYTYTYHGNFTMAERSIQIDGSRCSKDGFFKQYKYVDNVKIEKEIDERDNKRDVKMSALTNLIGNGITRMLGIRNMTYADLEEFAGIEKKNLGTVNYGGKDPKPPVRKTQSKSSQKKQTDTDKAGKADQGEVITKIDRVSVETGESQKTGKQWTRYHIHSVGGTEYKTFSETIAKDARSIQGGDAEALILFKTDKFGNTIETFEIQK